MKNIDKLTEKVYEIQEEEFKLHLLRKRLERVPKDLLIFYWKDVIEFEKRTSRKLAIDALLFEYSIQKNEDFKLKFKLFLRDFALPAREADYLISVRKTEGILEWINSWENNTFLGQHFDFQFHTFLTLPEEWLDQDRKSIQFPTLAIFLVASSKNTKQIFSGLEIVEYNQTYEVEIILRGNLDLVEIRGSYSVAKDFVATAIMDKNNPFSASESYFLGYSDDKKNGVVSVSRKTVSINKLKEKLDGFYQKITAPHNGSKVSQYSLTLDDLRDAKDETEPHTRALIEQSMQDMIKGTLGFKYKNQSHSFNVTRSGGLFFKKFLREEIVTYIIDNIYKA